MINVNRLHGRRVIYTDATAVTADNVLDILQQSLNTHTINSTEINQLYDYYKGMQPINNREKKVRPEIDNRIAENRANQIVQFKDGYLIGEPVQYISHAQTTEYGDDIVRLNALMRTAYKSKRDAELVHWFHICGTAFRIVLPSPYAYEPDGDSAPFELFTLDPRSTFVVYSSDLGHRPMAGVTISDERVDGTKVYSVYTKDMLYTIVDTELVGAVPHLLGGVPIIEYPANEERLGSFEVVIPILNAINTVSSNRVDGVEQLVQSLLVFKNVDIDDKMFATLREQGALKIGIDSDVEYLAQDLNQQQVQTLKEDLWQVALEIVGLPNRNGGSSTSDTGTAVIYRDGWSSADALAKSEETAFSYPELEQFLPIVLRICRQTPGVDISLKRTDLLVQFTRRNFENISGKSSVLISMLNNDKIDPRLAFEHCGMFSDPDLACEQSMAYRKHAQEEEMKSLMASAGMHNDEETDGQASQGSES